MLFLGVPLIFISRNIRNKSITPYIPLADFNIQNYWLLNKFPDEIFVTGEFH